MFYSLEFPGDKILVDSRYSWPNITCYKYLVTQYCMIEYCSYRPPVMAYLQLCYTALLTVIYTCTAQGDTICYYELWKKNWKNNDRNIGLVINCARVKFCFRIMSFTRCLGPEWVAAWVGWWLYLLLNELFSNSLFSAGDSLGNCTFSPDCDSYNLCQTIQDAGCVCNFGQCVIRGNPFFRGTQCEEYTDCSCRWIIYRKHFTKKI